MKTLLHSANQKTEQALNAIAHMPTKNLDVLMDDDFAQTLTDADFMKIAALLAQKSYNEGGCPIGAVIVNNATNKIVGKGHNTLTQEDHPYNHGETSAIRDAGRIDFSETTIYSSLSPCSVCATLIQMRGFDRVVVGDVTNACGTESFLKENGVKLDILEDQHAIELYARYRQEKPDQDLEDWQGLSAVHKAHKK